MNPYEKLYAEFLKLISDNPSVDWNDAKLIIQSAVTYIDTLHIQEINVGVAGLLQRLSTPEAENPAQPTVKKTPFPPRNPPENARQRQKQETMKTTAKPAPNIIEEEAEEEAEEEEQKGFSLKNLMGKKKSQSEDDAIAEFD